MSISLTSRGLVLVFALCILSSAKSVSQEPGLTSSKLIPPQLLRADQESAWPPGKRDREARVEVMFTVTKTGRSADVEIDGGFYDKRFADAAVSYVQSFRWRPALMDGKPVDYEGMRFAVIFRFSDGSELSKPFLVAMDDAVGLIRAGRFDAAQVQVEEMVADKVKWLYEYAVLQVALAETYQKAGHLNEALLASRRAKGDVGTEFKIVEFADEASETRRGVAADSSG